MIFDAEKHKVPATCKKTYPDEDDMQRCVEGEIEPCDVKIYFKGEQYMVFAEYVNTDYFKII